MADTPALTETEPTRTAVDAAMLERQRADYGERDYVREILRFQSALLASESRVRELTEAVRGFEWVRDHGCLTGDCPHEREHECTAALSDLLREIAHSARSVAGPGTGEPSNG